MIRPYLESDFKEVVSLIQLNIPKYFHLSEVEDFKNYLLNKREDYFVSLKNGEIVAVGGVNYGVDTDQTARVSWDIVLPKYQEQGLGKELLKFRLNHIKSQNIYNSVVVRTSQLTEGYYAKFGFVLKAIKQDFWAKGLDLYLMELKIN